MPKDKVDELLDDLDPDDPDKDTDLDLDKSDDVKELEDKIAKLEKKNMGLLNETKTQRRKRQQVEERLDKLTGTVENILTQKQTVTGDSPDTGVTIPDKIVLDYDEDGNPVLEPNKVVAAATAELNERIANLESMLQASVQQQQNTEDSTKVINSIVAEDERYGSAYNKYQGARKWVEDKVVEFQNDNNVQGFMSSGQALDHVFGEDLEEEFKNKFPGIDLERVVTAEDSQRHFRNTLASIAGSSGVSPDDVESGNKFKQVLAKPSSLGANANQKGAQLSVVEKLSNLTSEEIIGLSDDAVSQIEKALARES
jgi:hypothetical protein